MLTELKYKTISKARDKYIELRYSPKALTTLFNTLQERPGELFFINRLGNVEHSGILIAKDTKLTPSFFKNRAINFAQNEKPGRIVGIFNDYTQEFSLLGYSTTKDEYTNIKHCLTAHMVTGKNFTGFYQKPTNNNVEGLHQKSLTQNQPTNGA